MSSEKSLPPMRDDAERLFRKVAQKEAERHLPTRDLTREFLEYLEFSAVDAVKSATNELRGYGYVCLIDVQERKLVCGPDVVAAWDDYERRRTT
jgi:hypothetical protein